MMPPRRLAEGFTLVEMLVSLAILTLLCLVIAGQIDLTNRTFLAVNGKIEQFRAARLAFDAMTRKLSQATLNSYIDLVDASNDPQTSTAYTGPDHYQRESELRFYSAPSSTVPLLVNSPTHCVFFCAPLGVGQGSGDQGLEQLINVCGYYVQYSSDPQVNNVPSFFPATSSAQTRTRFRLMEMVVPSESVDVYNYTVGQSPYDLTSWFTDYLGAGSTYVTSSTHVLADNVIALIVMPRLSTQQETQLGVTNTYMTSNYAYDSGNLTAQTTTGGAYLFHQLPPILEVTMVAIDEPSAIRYQAQNGTPATMPTLVPAGLFTSVANYTSDLTTLTNALAAKRLNFRVFTSNISITGAHWSTDKNE